jgi:hypothetical protein
MVSKLEYTINHDPIQQKVNEMIEYTHEIKTYPKKGTKYEQFWQHMKHGVNASFLPQCLEESSYLKEDYQQSQAKRDAKQGKPTFPPEEIMKMIIKDANENKTHPIKSKVLENGVRLGMYWSEYKTKSKEYYKKYLAQCIKESIYLAKDYQNLQEYRKKTPEQHWEDQLILALECMCTHENRPNQRDNDPDIKKQGQWIRRQVKNHNHFQKGNLKIAGSMKNINIRTKWETVEKMMKEKNWKGMETYLLELKKKNHKKEDVNEDAIEDKQEIESEQYNENEYEQEIEIETEEEINETIETEEEIEIESEKEIEEEIESEKETEEEIESEKETEEEIESEKEIEEEIESEKEDTVNQCRQQTKRGPPPRKKGYTVSSKSIDRVSWFYIMRWGNTDLYKFGYTSNISQRLKSINNTGNIINKFDENYHLFHCIFKKEFKTEKEAYVFEQNVFNEVSLNLCEHIDGEFYKIEFEKLKEVFSPFQIIFILNKHLFELES